MVDTVASLQAVIGADVSGLDSGLAAAETRLTSFGDKIKNVGASVMGAGAQITALTAPIALALGAGVQTASEFQDVMAEIGARTGATSAEMETLSDYALQMGADTAFSGQQAADALLQLLTSGSSVEESLTMLPSILDAAAASGADLGATADTVTDIMAAFGLGAEDAENVVNSLAKAAGASSADMVSLGQGFGNVAGVANLFGMDVNETAAALAILSENGIKGAEAGTALKSMLQNMSRDTDQVKGLWNELGLSMYDAQGNMREMPTVLDELKFALEDLPAAEQQRIMSGLAGTYGMTALAALLGATSIEEMEASMDAAADASDVADARMNTFSGSIDSLKGSFDTLMITALTPFMDEFLTPMVRDLTNVVNTVTDWANENPELTSTIVSMATAAVIAGPAMMALGGALLLLSSPLVLVSGAVAAAAAGLVGLSTIIPNIDFSPITTSINEAVNSISINTGAISAFVTKIGDSISDSFSGTENIDLGQIETWSNDNMDAILNTVVSVAGIVLGGPIGMAIGAASLVASAIETDFLGIGTFLEESDIASNIETAINDLKTTIDDIIGTLFGQQEAESGGFFGQWKNNQSSPTPLFVKDLQTAVDAIISVGSSITDDIITGFKDLGTGIAGFISNLSGTETEGLYNVVRPIIAVVGGLSSAAVTFISTGIGSFLSSLGEALPALGTAVNSSITGLSRLGEGDIGGALTSFGNAIWSIGDSFLSFTGGIADDFITAINDVTGLELPSVEDGLAAWGFAFESAWTVLQVIVDNVKRGISAFALDVQLQVVGFVASMRNTIMNLTGIDISPTVNLELEALQTEALKLEISDMARQALQGMNGVGEIDLSQWITGVSDSTGQGIGFNLAQQIFSDPESLGEQGKIIIEQALRNAIDNVDLDMAEVFNVDTGEAFNVPEIKLLSDAADLLGIDTSDIEAEIDTMISAAEIRAKPKTDTYDAQSVADEIALATVMAIEATTVDASVNANISINPNISMPDISAAIAGGGAGGPVTVNNYTTNVQGSMLGSEEAAMVVADGRENGPQ